MLASSAKFGGEISLFGVPEKLDPSCLKLTLRKDDPILEPIEEVVPGTGNIWINMRMAS
jgi:hypothetical protein